MASTKTKVALEKEDHERDAAFMKALHGKSTEAAGGFAAMLSKDKEAKRLAVEEYFKHFDNKRAETETEADREVGFRHQPWLQDHMLTNSKRPGQRNMPPLRGSKSSKHVMVLLMDH